MCICRNDWDNSIILPFIYKNAAVKDQDTNYREGLLYFNQDKKTNFPVLNNLHGHSSEDFRVYEVHLKEP